MLHKMEVLTGRSDRVKEIERCERCGVYRITIFLNDDMDVFTVPFGEDEFECGGKVVDFRQWCCLEG